MGWMLFQLAAWLLVFLLIPLHKWKKSYFVGIFGLLIILAVDGTLVRLGAIRYFHDGLFIYGLPLPYFISYFPGGMLFDHLRPKSLIGRFLYIPAVSITYLIIELIMKYLGYYTHINWNTYNSFILNLLCFTVVLWFAEWWEEFIEKKESY